MTIRGEAGYENLVPVAVDPSPIAVRTIDLSIWDDQNVEVLGESSQKNKKVCFSLVKNYVVYPEVYHVVTTQSFNEFSMANFDIYNNALTISNANMIKRHHFRNGVSCCWHRCWHPHLNDVMNFGLCQGRVVKLQRQNFSCFSLQAYLPEPCNGMEHPPPIYIYTTSFCLHLNHVNPGSINLVDLFIGGTPPQIS